jgi:hypothetical protein
VQISSFLIVINLDQTGWQKIYENDPYEILEKRNIILTDKKKEQVLGAEVAMWSEQVRNLSSGISFHLSNIVDTLPCPRCWDTSCPETKGYKRTHFPALNVVFPRRDLNW